MGITDPDRVFDGLLVQQFIHGDRKAIDLLFKRWNKRVLAYVFRMVIDREKAKDITQEVWIVAISKIHKLNHPNKIGSWLLSIAHNKCIDSIRTNKVIYEFSDQYDTEEIPCNKDEKKNQVNKLRISIRQLKKQDQQILNLFYLEGMNIHEISEILLISVGTVKSRLFNARERLKKIIKK